MDREDAERLARMEAYLETMVDDIKDIKTSIMNHVVDDNERHEDMTKEIRKNAAHIASIRTKQKLLWTAFGSILSALGFSHLGSLFK